MPGRRTRRDRARSSARAGGRGAELDECVRVRGEERERDTDREEEDAGEQASSTGASASARTPKPVAPVANRRQLARRKVAVTSAPTSAPRPKDADRRPKPSGPTCERVRCEERDENVEVEADRADDRDDREHGAELRVATHEAERTAHARRRSAPRGRARPGAAPPPQARERGKHREEAEGVDDEADPGARRRRSRRPRSPGRSRASR